MTDRQFVLSIYPKAFPYKNYGNTIAIFDRNQPSRYDNRVNGYEPISKLWQSTHIEAWADAAEAVRYEMLERLES